MISFLYRLTVVLLCPVFLIGALALMVKVWLITGWDWAVEYDPFKEPK